MSHFFADRQNRKWVLTLLIVVLLFLLLAWAVWLYYNLQIHQVREKTISAFNRFADIKNRLS